MKKLTVNVDSDIKNQINLMAEDGVNQAFIAQQLSIPRATVSRCIQEGESRVNTNSPKPPPVSKTLRGKPKKNMLVARREAPMVLLNLPLSELQGLNGNQKKPVSIDFSLPQASSKTGKNTRPQKRHISDYDSKLCRLFGIEKEITILLENLSETTVKKLKDQEVDSISAGKRKNAFKVTEAKSKKVKTGREKEEESFVKIEKLSGPKSKRTTKNSPNYDFELENLILTPRKKPVINIVDLATNEKFKKIISTSKVVIKDEKIDKEKSQKELTIELDSKSELPLVSERYSLSNHEVKKENSGTIESGEEKKHLSCQNSLNNVTTDGKKLPSFVDNSNSTRSLVHEELLESKNILPKDVTERDNETSCSENTLQTSKKDGFKALEKKDSPGNEKKLMQQTSLTNFVGFRMKNGFECQTRKRNIDASMKEGSLESSEKMGTKECLKLEEIFENSFEDVCITEDSDPKPPKKQRRRSSKRRKIRKKKVSDTTSDYGRKQNRTKKSNDVKEPFISKDASCLKSDSKNLKVNEKDLCQSSAEPKKFHPEEHSVKSLLNQTHSKMSPLSKCKKRVLRDEDYTQSSKRVRFKEETLSVKIVDSPNYALIDTEKIKLGFRELLCPKCHKNVGVKFPCISDKLDTELEINCTFCNTIKQFKKSSRCLTQLDENSLNYNSLYLRLVCSSLDFGGGYKQLESTCAALEIPHLALKTFQKYCKFILKQTKAKVDQIIRNAGQSVHKAYNEAGQASEHKGIRNISVFYDGSWIPKGRYSNYGLVVVLDLKTGLILDYHLMSRFCRKCVLAQKRKSKNGTLKHIELGQCEVNFRATPKEMEDEGKNVLCHRSTLKHQLIYKDPNVEIERKNQVINNILVKENLLNELIPNGEPIHSNKIHEVCKNEQVQKNESPEISKDNTTKANEIPQISEISEDETMETDKPLETSKDESGETNKLPQISKETILTNTAIGISNDETMLANETFEISKDKANSSLDPETVLSPLVTSDSSKNNIIQEDTVPSLNSKTVQQDDTVLSLNSKTVQQEDTVPSLNSKTVQQDNTVLSLNSKTVQQDDTVLSLNSKTVQQDDTVLSLNSKTVQQDDTVLSLNSKTMQQDDTVLSLNSKTVLQDDTVPSLNSKTVQTMASSPIKTMTFVDETLKIHKSTTDSGKLLYPLLMKPMETQGLCSENCQDISESERLNTMAEESDVNDLKTILSKCESTDTVKSTIETSENESLDLDEIINNDVLLGSEQMESGDQGDGFMKLENIFEIMENDSNKFKPIISSLSGGTTDNLGSLEAGEKEALGDELEEAGECSDVELEFVSPSKISCDDGEINIESKSDTDLYEKSNISAACHITDRNESKQLRSSDEDSNVKDKAKNETKNLNSEIGEEVPNLLNGKDILSRIEVFLNTDENKTDTQVDEREIENPKNKHEVLSLQSKEQPETTQDDLSNPIKSLNGVSSEQEDLVQHSKDNLSHDLCQNQIEEKDVTNSEKHSTSNPSVMLHSENKLKDCSQQSNNDHTNEIEDSALQQIPTNLIPDVSPEMDKEEDEIIIDDICHTPPKPKKLAVDELPSQSPNQLKNDSEPQIKDRTKRQTCEDECLKSIETEIGDSQHGNEEEVDSVNDSIPLKNQFAQVLKRIKVETLRSVVFKKCNMVKYFHRDSIEFACIYAIISHNTNIKSFFDQWKQNR